MSNIYIQEPPTFGKVLLVTSAGDIDVELWSKEAPKACRNFIQLSMEGYYNGTIFHRVVKDFIVQGGDPTGTGEGGESIYGKPFKDEIHSRLRFNRRGLIAMANAGRDDNGSQFFFTLAAAPELQGKHTIFGKIVGDTIYNMLKLDGETDENERPLHCHKIIKTEILNNPFPDIVPRVKAKKDKKEKKKYKEKGVKNFKLLSFGEEAEEDEEETKEISKVTKIKSSHDLLNDPKLSAEPAVNNDEKIDVNENVSDSENDVSKNQENSEEETKEEYYLGKSKEDELLKRRQEIQKEIQQLKDDYRNRKKSKAEHHVEEEGVKESASVKDNAMVDEYKTNLVKYGEKKNSLPLKGSARENFTMEMLSKFKQKLKELKETVTEEDSAGKDDEDGNSDNWMAHTLKFEAQPVLARDANTKTDDWYDITDPRNPINKRRREASKHALEKKTKRSRD